MKIIGIISTTVLLMILELFLIGYTIQSVYNWLLVPIYNISPLNLSRALAIGTALSFITLPLLMSLQAIKAKLEPEKSVGITLFKGVIDLLVLCGAILLKAYIISSFI